MIYMYDNVWMKESAKTSVLNGDQINNSLFGFIGFIEQFDLDKRFNGLDGSGDFEFLFGLENEFAKLVGS